MSADEPPAEPGWASPGGWSAPSGGSPAGDASPPPPGSTYPPPPATSYPLPPGWGAGPGYGWRPSGPPPAPRPGIVPLRPLAVGELLDGGFTTIRRYPGPALGFTALIVLAVQVVQVVASYLVLHGISERINGSVHDGTINGGLLGRSYAVSGGIAVLTFLATILISGLLAVVVSEGVLGRPITLSDAWARTRPAVWRLAGVALIVAGIVIGLTALGTLPGILVAVAGSTGGGVGLAVIGGLAALCYSLYLAINLSLAGPAVVLERVGVRVALRRSRTLVRGSWWRIFGISLLAYFIAGIVASIISLPFQFLGGLDSLFSGNVDAVYTFHALIISGVGSVLAATLVRPFSAAIVTLLYVDRRMRAEGLDLTLTQAAASQPVASW